MAQTHHPYRTSSGPFDKDNPTRPNSLNSFHTLAQPNDIFITEAQIKHDPHEARDINPIDFGLLDSEYALSDSGEMFELGFSQDLDDTPQHNDNNSNNTNTHNELSQQVQFILHHQLYSSVINFLYASKTSQVIPTAPKSFSILGTSLSLDEFLESQGLLNESQDHDDDRQKFLQQLQVIKVRYHEEIKKIELYEEATMQKVLQKLKEQCLVRPITDTELRTRLYFIQHRLDMVKCCLIQKVYDVILLLAKKYHQFKPGKRTLPKHASRTLSEWFYSHLSEPYPSEEEKMMLASQIGITMTQINNWFGNKRIRYKRKQQALSPQDEGSMSN